jgi:outer membrane protein assembly factor BamB
LDTKDGSVRWRHILSNPLRAAPTVAGGRVYVVSIDNELTALDAHTGMVLWHHNGIAESATLMGASCPTVAGESVVVAYSSGEIYSLRAENGRVSWNYVLSAPAQVGALPAIADIRGLPVVDHGRIYAISHSGRLASIDERTGDRVWETDIGGINTPILGANALFILSSDAHLLAIDRDSGRVLWVHELQHNIDRDDHDSPALYWTGPIMANDRLVLVNSKGHIVFFSPDNGAELKVIKLGEAIFVPPIVVNNMLYVVTDDAHLIAIK